MQRRSGLDGLRGIAALMVLIHHAAPQTGGFTLFASGYLAVDLFFMLSGFVIASAYEDRFANGMTAAMFGRARLVRLYPVMAIGIFLGAASALKVGADVEHVLMRLPAQLLFIPIFAGALGVFALNGVQWSLFFELFANGVHFVAFRRMSTGMLIGATAAACLWMALTANAYQWFGTGDIGTNFAGGFPRVLFSYSAGVLMFRLRQEYGLKCPQVSAPILFMLLLLALIFADSAKHLFAAWQVDFLVVTIVLPPLLFATIDARVDVALEPGMLLLGAMSYPLYAVHLPILTLVHVLLPDPGFRSFAVAVTLALAMAYLLSKWLKPGAKRQWRGRATKSENLPARLLN